MRHGRIGSQWRHIKQTNTYSGSNLMFIDGKEMLFEGNITSSIVTHLGTVRIDDSFKYPIPRFGYPPLKIPQHRFPTSSNDHSYLSSNPATHSLDATGWSNNEGHPARPTISQQGNRSHDSNKHHSFDESQFHEVKESINSSIDGPIIVISGEITDSRTAKTCFPLDEETLRR